MLLLMKMLVCVDGVAFLVKGSFVLVTNAHAQLGFGAFAGTVFQFTPTALVDVTGGEYEWIL